MSSLPIPSDLFCPNSACAAYGQAGVPSIRCHSWREQRYRCTVCGKTFTATAAKTVGMAQRSLEMMMAYAQTRVTFGSPLADRQAIQFMIADSATELRAARLLVYETAWMYDQGRDVRDASYQTKIYCTEMATRVVDRAIQVHGGIGLTEELPLEYWYRELRSLRITEGVTEVLRWRLARNLMRAAR